MTEPLHTGARLPARDLRRAWGEFLEGYQWAHFLTLTFRRESGPDFAARAYDRYLRRVTKCADRPLYWFMATEYGRRAGRLHLHALTGNTDTLERSRLQHEWRDGFSRVLDYQPHLGATHYLTKYITKDLADYDVSPHIREALALHGRQSALAFYPRDRALPTSVLRQRKHAVSESQRALRADFYRAVARHTEGATDE